MYRVVMFRRFSTALSQGRIEEGGWEGGDEVVADLCQGTKRRIQVALCIFGHRTGAASLIIVRVFFVNISARGP